MQLLSSVLLSAVSLAVAAQQLPLEQVDAAGQPPELQKAVEAVAARERRVRSALYKWTARRVVPVALLPDEYSQMPQEAESAAQSEHKVLEENHRLLIADSRLRHDYTGWMWYPGEREFVPWEYAASFDRGVVHALSGNYGLIAADVGAVVSVDLAPLIYVHRLLEPKLLGADPSGLQMIGQATVAGHPCVVIEARDESGEPGLIYQWWLAQGMDYVLLQWQHMTGEGMLLAQADAMAYEPDEEVGWRLRSWRVVKAGMHETTECQATEVRFNEAVPEDAFEITFPVGTQVGDHIANTYYTVEEAPAKPQEPAGPSPPRTPAGRIRENATPETRPAKPQAQAPPLAAAQAPLPRRGPVSWIIVGLLALAVLVVAAVFIGRRKTAR